VINCRQSLVNQVDNTCDGQRSTDDLSGKFITLRVRFYLQHSARELARRAGPSETDDTCYRTKIE